MRVLSLALPASLLSTLVLAASAAAQSMPYPLPYTAPVTTVQVTAPSVPVRLQEEEIRGIAGTYDLSNGWRMKVRAAQRYIDATIDKEKPMRLVAVSPTKFVSGDGNVTMVFRQGDLGDDMTMSYVPDPLVGTVVTIGSGAVAQR